MRNSQLLTGEKSIFHDSCLCIFRDVVNRTDPNSANISFVGMGDFGITKS